MIKKLTIVGLFLMGTLTCNSSELLDSHPTLPNKAAIGKRLADAKARGDMTVLVIGDIPPSERTKAHYEWTDPAKWAGRPPVTDFYLDIETNGQDMTIFESEGRFLKISASANDPKQLQEWLPLFKGSLDVMMFDERVVKYLHLTPTVIQSFLTALKPGGEFLVDCSGNEFIDMYLPKPFSFDILYKEIDDNDITFGVRKRDPIKNEYVFESQEIGTLKDMLREYYKTREQQLPSVPPRLSYVTSGHSLSPYGPHIGLKISRLNTLLEDIERYKNDPNNQSIEKWPEEHKAPEISHRATEISKETSYREELANLERLQLQRGAKLKLVFKEFDDVYKEYVKQWFVDMVLTGELKDRFSVEIVDKMPLRDRGSMMTTAIVKRAS
jgi:hypothetical protein